MKYKKTGMSLAMLLFSIGGIYAQQSINAAGGNGIGTGGTISYSIGQVAYISSNGTGGNISEGVQQTYEIFTTSMNNESLANIEIHIYPNPAVDVLSLNISSEKVHNMSFQLIDMQGKIIANQKITSNNTSIPMEGLSKSTYFLNIINNNKSIQSFKILKK